MLHYTHEHTESEWNKEGEKNTKIKLAPPCVACLGDKQANKRGERHPKAENAIDWQSVSERVARRLQFDGGKRAKIRPTFA